MQKRQFIIILDLLRNFIRPLKSPFRSQAPRSSSANLFKLASSLRPGQLRWPWSLAAKSSIFSSKASYARGLSLLLLGGIFLGKFCLKQTDGFTIAAVLSSRPFNAAWEPRPLTGEEQKQVQGALDQKYRYFGRGGQSYIFFSEDGNFALKLFKQEKFTLPLWMRLFHIPYLLDRYRNKKIWSREDKLLRDFSSYKIAFDELQEETGVVYVHLNKTESWKKNLTLIDRLNISHKIDLGTLDFILQRRAELVYDKIDRLMREKNEQEARECVSQIVDLIVTRCQKGYHDRDPNIRTNCGFLGSHAIKIDVGRFVKNPEMQKQEVMKSELIRITAPFKDWLHDKYPALASHLEGEIARL